MAPNYSFVGKLILYFFFSFTALFSFAQTKTLSAVRTTAAPVIDGHLDDREWQQAPIARDFIQNNPIFGMPSTVRIEARILYDNNAVYIGAYIYDDPEQIRKQLTARDGEQRQDVDYFAVFFDTYNDQQNGFQFLVTTKNVQTDVKLNPTANSGFGDFGDRSWDAVWQSKVSVKQDGWVVEMLIPYISLRFPKKDVQTWGLQFLHYSRRKNESSYWTSVDPNVNGFINQFGKLEQLENIQPPLRLSLSPYITGGYRSMPDGSGMKSDWLRNGGMDVKYGINESFTVDATLIPDFGQVISDNLINNLSPFEIFFKENRPFFTEGTEIFNKSQLFYSRRVGATPANYAAVQRMVANTPSLELVNNPSVTQLYNAIKFSGRTNAKLGIGVFNAVTAPMHAEVRDNLSGRNLIIETEPLANYNIVVLDQALKHRSSVTFTNTNVMRSGAARDANVSALDWSLFTSDNMYQLRGTARYSQIFGYTPFTGNLNLIEDTIRLNGALFTKPYDGFSGTMRFGKVSGKLQFSAQTGMETHGYDPNDLGFLQNANKVTHQANISWNQLSATNRFLVYRYTLGINSTYLYRGYRFSESLLSASAFWWFKNFWDLNISVNSYPTWQNDYFDLRTPGMFLRRPAEATFGINGSTDSRKRLFVSLNAKHAVRDAEANAYNQFDIGVRYRFSDRLSVTAKYFRQYEENQRGYAFMRNPDGTPIVGFRDYNDYETTISGIYSFTSRLNVTLRARHYLNHLHYNSFYDIDRQGILYPKTYASVPEQNYNVFNVDAFLTWDFRLGSRMIFGWKNWNGDPFSVMNQTGYVDNLKQVLGNSLGNELTLRVIYFIDYNQLRSKR